MVRRNDVLTVEFLCCSEPVFINNEQVLLKGTGRLFPMGSGILLYRNGMLIVEKRETDPLAAKRRRISSLGVGLQNSDQNCFCNSVLQAIKCADSEETLQVLPDLDNSVKDIAEGFVCYELQKVSK